MLVLVIEAELTIRALADQQSCVLGELREGMVVDAYGCQGEWWRINYRGLPGYVAREALQVYQQADKLNAIVATEELEVRAAPALEAEVVERLKSFQVMPVRVAKNGWLALEGEPQGYISHGWVDAYLPQQLLDCKVGSSACPLYTAPCFEAEVRAELDAGVKLERINMLGEWGEVTYQGAKVYLPLFKLVAQSTSVEALIRASLRGQSS